MIRKPLITLFAVGALALALAPGQAQAQTRFFEIAGAGVGPDGLPLPGEPPRSHWAVGIATQLGLYYGQGEVETNTATFNSNGTITGQFGSATPFVFTGANGDVLACYYGRTDFGASTPGTFTLVPVPSYGAGWYIAIFVAEFVPFDPLCTGKFQGVTGGWTMYAMTGPFLLGSSESLDYAWEGAGSLTYSGSQ